MGRKRSRRRVFGWPLLGSKPPFGQSRPLEPVRSPQAAGHRSPWGRRAAEIADGEPVKESQKLVWRESRINEGEGLGKPSEGAGRGVEGGDEGLGRSGRCEAP